MKQCVLITVCLNVCRDPNLWTVKCRIGTEKETVMLLMRKYITLMHTDTVRIQHMTVVAIVIYTQLACKLQLPSLCCNGCSIRVFC